MMKYSVFAVILCCLTHGALAATHKPAPEVVSTSTQSATEERSADQTPALIEKVRELRERLRRELAKSRLGTPEEARQFRTKAISLAVEFNNLLHKKSRIQAIGDEDLEIHQLIYAHPRIASHIFASELEICKSTEAYDYKAQADAITGKKAQAEADWTDAIALAPEAELLLHRGHLYLTQHKYDQAIDDFTRALKAGGTAPLYHSRATAYYRKDDYAAAAEDLELFFKHDTNKEYSRSVSVSHICAGLRKHGFTLEGCAAAAGGNGK